MLLHSFDCLLPLSAAVRSGHPHTAFPVCSVHARPPFHSFISLMQIQPIARAERLHFHSTPPCSPFTPCSLYAERVHQMLLARTVPTEQRCCCSICRCLSFAWATELFQSVRYEVERRLPSWHAATGHAFVFATCGSFHASVSAALFALLSRCSYGFFFSKCCCQWRRLDCGIVVIFRLDIHFYILINVFLTLFACKSHFNLLFILFDKL